MFVATTIVAVKKGAQLAIAGDIQLLENLFFEAAYPQRQKIIIDRDYVEPRLKLVVQGKDLSRYIL
ncbi:MAG: hypothetical protein NTV45_08080 [Firmicutes bacterium]|nr:hypothetical protein [Bacillota bacterium]